MIANLSEIADLCEQAEGPSRELDEQIAELMGWQTEDQNGFLWWVPPHLGDQFWSHCPAFTASLDAAMTLVPEGWTAWELRSHAARTRFSADLSRLTECDASQEDWAHGRGSTPALALCAAALRAHLQGQATTPNDSPAWGSP